MAVPFQKSVDNGLEKHWVNFVDVVKSRNMTDLHCPIQAGSDIACFSQMGNLAYRTGQKLYWDAGKQAFTDDAVNKKYFMKEYHNGYELPKV